MYGYTMNATRGQSDADWSAMYDAIEDCLNDHRAVTMVRIDAINGREIFPVRTINYTH